MLDVPERGIFLFFLLLVFSKLSYPSALDPVDPGGGGLLECRATSSKRPRTDSTALPLLIDGDTGVV